MVEQSVVNLISYRRVKPPLPPMQIKGGKQAKVQPPLNLEEPLLVVQPKKSRA